MKKNIIIIIVITALLAIIGVLIFLFIRNKVEEKTLIQLSGEEFKEKINNKESFILVIVQTGCHFCEEFKPTVNDVIKEHNITMYSLNLTNLSAEEKTFLRSVVNSESTPTTIFITDGEEETSLNRLIGKVSKSTLIRRLESLGYIK